MTEQYYEEKFSNIHKELERHTHQISANEKRINEFEKSFAVSMESINTSLSSLSELPNVMTEMRETMILMQVELKRNTEEIAKVNAKVNKNKEAITSIDEDGKFNFRQWIKQNWMKLVVGGLLFRDVFVDVVSKLIV